VTESADGVFLEKTANKVIAYGTINLGKCKTAFSLMFYHLQLDRGGPCTRDCRRHAVHRIVANRFPLIRSTNARIHMRLNSPADVA
jgi:hypothetical protein